MRIESWIVDLYGTEDGSYQTRSLLHSLSIRYRFHNVREPQAKAAVGVMSAIDGKQSQSRLYVRRGGETGWKMEAALFGFGEDVVKSMNEYAKQLAVNRPVRKHASPAPRYRLQ